MFFRLYNLFFVVVFLGLPGILQSQESSGDSVKLAITPYGSFRGHMAVFDEEIEIQENASRIGFEISVYGAKFRYFAGAELAINLFRSPNSLNVDGNTSGGFLRLDQTQNAQVFASRLGFLGVDMGKYGTITIGKQWGVYYDVSGYTDRFNVFGGQGSATYVANGDGGETGTGRASQAVVYRNVFGRLHLGGQVQMKSASNGYFIDGFALSAQYEVLKGLRLGTTYNKAYFSDFFVDNILGLNGQPEYFVIGASYNSETWDFGLVYATHTNGDLAESIVEEELVSTIFDASGLEFLAKFKQPKYALLAGFNGYFPDVDNFSFDEDFERQFYIIGGEFKPTKFAYFYAEYRYSNSTNSLGLDALNVFTLGIRLDISRTWERSFR